MINSSPSAEHDFAEALPAVASIAVSGALWASSVRNALTCDERTCCEPGSSGRWLQIVSEVLGEAIRSARLANGRVVGSHAPRAGATIGPVIDFVAEPETREALAAHLRALGVSEGSYHLFGGLPNMAFVMDRRPEGWVVFYSERGSEFPLSVHEHEADACADLLARVTSEEHVFFDLVAGPAPAAIADEAFDAWLNSRGVTREDLDPTDWKFDDVPWVAGPYWRRYFVRITAAQRLAQTP